MSGLKDELMQAMIHHSPDDEDCVVELVCSKVEHLADAVSPVVANAVSAARAEVLAKVVTTLVDDERARQIQRWGLKHDREHGLRLLIYAAEAYECADVNLWPWERASFKPRTRIQNLIRAAALYQAAADARVRLSEGNADTAAQEGRRRCVAALLAHLGGTDD